MKIIKDYTFVDDDEEGDQQATHQAVRAQVRIQETVSDAFGLFVWPSALALAHYIWDHRCDLKDKAVLELGAGVGLPGLLAAHPLVGARRVVLTDRREGQQVLENAKEAVLLNGYQADICEVRGLSWGYPERWWKDIEAEVILGSDCFYHEGDFQDLLHTLTYFIYHQPPPPSSRCQCRCLMAYHDRGADSIYYSLQRWRLHARALDLPTRLADDDTYASIHLMEITAANPP